MRSTIYTGSLAHVRERPKRNQFRYGVYMLFLDLDETDELARRCRLFSRNRWNAFSFHDADHFKFIDQEGDRSRIISQENVRYEPARYRGLDTRGRINLLLADAGMDFRLGKVYLLTNPRVFGYVFNPVSFYYCFDTEGTFRVLVSEVNNTSGDQKMFVTEVDSSKVHTDRQRKHFYVSPFIPFDTEFVWRFTDPGERLMVEIDSMQGADAVLRATFSGTRNPFDDRVLLGLMFRYPLLTFMIIGRIHMQAAKLFFVKRLRFLIKEQQDEKIAEAITKEE